MCLPLAQVRDELLTTFQHLFITVPGSDGRQYLRPAEIAYNLVELVERPIASDVEEVAAKQVFDALSGFEPVFGRWHKKAHQNVAILSSDWDFGGEDLKRMLWC